MTAAQALELYKSRDASEKLFRGDKSYLGNKSFRVHTSESVQAKIFIEFVALIIRSRFYTCLKEQMQKSGKKNYMTVPAAIREVEKIELIRQSDRGYRMDYAVMATQKEILKDYICSQRQKHHKMPADPVMVKTIVTMDMAQQIAEHYGLRTINVLTGFKFIGEQIGKLEEQKKADSYVFGFEESYGYLTGSYVRDKDGVNGACMICEMFSYYATKGIGLLDKLDELYRMYGYCLNILHSYEFDGSAGFVKMQKIMKAFRGDVEKFGNKKVLKLLDYAAGLDGLPKSDVLKFLLEDNCSIVIRPSGTEPKLKMYISVSAEDKETAEKTEEKICRSAEEYLNVPKMDIRNPR